MDKSTVHKKYSVTEVWPDEMYKDLKILKVVFEEGISVEIMNLGGIIKMLEVPDKNGNKENVVLNYGSINKYFQDKAYVGCLVGRYANRIKNGAFSLNDKTYQLPCNHGRHHLHGGYNGFDKQIWNFEKVQEQENKVIIKLSYSSKDGDQGYPGNLDVEVDYIISENSLEIIYSAIADQDTIFNPTNHSYFNLSGDFQSIVDDHWLQIKGSRILEVDKELIPTGKLIPVKGSSYDFTEVKKIGDYPYDTCYELESGAVLRHDESGREMKVETSFPGLQLYTADYLEQSGLKNRSGVCLETQYFPDSPNNSSFPNTVLAKGAKFLQRTLYTFYKRQS